VAWLSLQPDDRLPVEIAEDFTVTGDGEIKRGPPPRPKPDCGGLEVGPSFEVTIHGTRPFGQVSSAVYLPGTQPPFELLKLAHC